MKKIDLILTALLLVAGVATFVVGGLNKNTTATDAGVIICIVSVVPILVASVIEAKGYR